MQISTEGTSAFSMQERLESDISTVFRESLGLVHVTLIREYRMQESEAVKLEEDLSVWFHRFCRRAGSPAPRDCRHFLLVMGCLFARGQQKFSVETGDRPFDERLARVLRRDPADVAREVSRPLKLLYHQLHTS